MFERMKTTYSDYDTWDKALSHMVHISIYYLILPSRYSYRNFAMQVLIVFSQLSLLCLIFEEIQLPKTS